MNRCEAEKQPEVLNRIIPGTVLAEKIHFQGRNLVTTERCTFFWPGSGIEIRLNGEQLWICTSVPEGVIPP